MTLTELSILVLYAWYFALCLSVSAKSNSSFIASEKFNTWMSVEEKIQIKLSIVIVDAISAIYLVE